VFYGRTKIFTIFALFGFFIGTAAYFIFNWFVTNNLIKLTSISVIDILLSPWFISGVAGAVLSIVVLTLIAHSSRGT
jgi:hypothetical protein